MYFWDIRWKDFKEIDKKKYLIAYAMSIEQESSQNSSTHSPVVKQM